MTIRFRLGGLILMAVMLGALAMSACSTTPTSPSTSETSTTVTKPYGSLTIANNFGANIDPLLEPSVGFTTIGSAVFDTLWYKNVESYSVTPGMAERWEISPDGMTHTFYIRKGVRFHDGSDLTGEDVKFSIERMIAPTSLSPAGAATWRSLIGKVELKDTYTVVLQLKSPQFDLLPKNDNGNMSAVVPKKYIENKGSDYFPSHPMGSGPWKALKYEQGVRLELEAVEDHWQSKPKFKNITVLSIPEMSTRVAMLKTGELDMAAVSADSVTSLEAAGLRIFSYPSGGGFFGYPFYDIENPQKFAFGDVRVRKALQLAINSKEMADKQFGGRAEPVSVALSYVDSVSKANVYDPNLLKPDPYDPEGAKKLLADAGYPNGFSTKLYDVGGGDLRSIVSLTLGGYWRKIGVNGEITPYDYAAFMPKMQSRSADLWNNFYTFISPGAQSWDYMITRYHSTKSTPKNLKNPKLDGMLDSVLGIKDPVERGRLQLEAAVLAKNEYTTLSILGTHNILALGNKVGSVAPARYMVEISGLMYETITHRK
ncbi:MAG: ABC transporter substrate-binding protein [Dehalococcoidia bacterium]|nr:ABC transporter substrate-binding protein [Dehalococcoidia bacterium]